MAERLSTEIEKLACDVADALAQVPEYDPTWDRLVTDEFLRIFGTKATQEFPPSLGSAAT